MKKLLYLTIVITLMGLTSCGEGGTGFDDGTPITQTSWKSVEEFNIPTDTTWEHFNQANLISTITFFDSTSGRITLTLPEVIPAVFSLDFEYTFDGADGEIYYGWGNSFDFTRSSSSTIYMTLPAELLENLDVVSDISDLQGGGINLTFDKVDFISPITPYTDVQVSGSKWEKSMRVSLFDEQMSYSYSLYFSSPYGFFSYNISEQHGNDDPNIDSLTVPFVYTPTTNATGTISVPNIPQIPEELKSFKATYRIEGRQLWFSTGLEEEGFNTEIPLNYVGQ